jgi:hypothetical protein
VGIRRVVAGLALCGGVLASATACARDVGYDPRGDGDIAARIEAAHARGVDSVSRHVGDDMDGATIDIAMTDDAGWDDVKHVLCDVAIPARDAGDPSEGLSIDVWLGSRIVAWDREADCTTHDVSAAPAAASPAPTPSGAGD